MNENKNRRVTKFLTNNEESFFRARQFLNYDKIHEKITENNIGKFTKNSNQDNNNKNEIEENQNNFDKEKLTASFYINNLPTSESNEQSEININNNLNYIYNNQNSNGNNETTISKLISKLKNITELLPSEINSSNRNKITEKVTDSFNNFTNLKPKTPINKNSKNSYIEMLKTQEELTEKLNKIKENKILEKSENLFKKKTFSTDIVKKEKLKKELDEIRLEKEMEECTFKPKIVNESILNSPFKSNLPKKTISNFNYSNKNKKINNNVKNNNDTSFDVYCSFKPKINDPPNFEIKNINKTTMINTSKLYYDRVNKARMVSQEKIKIKNFDYSTKYDERRKKDLMMNSYCHTDVDETYATFNPKEKKNIKYGERIENLRKKLQNFSFEDV